MTATRRQRAPAVLLLCSGALAAMPGRPASAENTPEAYRQAARISGLVWQLERGDNTKMKVTAARELGKRELAAVAPALVRALAAERPVREAAAAALVQLGAERALPALKRALENGPERLRTAAARVLGKLDDLRPQVVALLCRALGSEHQATRRAAVAGLRETDLEAVPALLRVWDHERRHASDSDADLSRAVVGLLRGMGQRLAPQLQRALASGDAELAEAAARMLHLVGPSVVPTLRRALRQHPVDNVRLAAARSAGLFEEQALRGELLPALAEALQRDRVAAVREASARSLQRLGQGSEALLAALRDPHPSVRRTAVAALSHEPAPAPGLVTALRALLADQDPGVRGAAVAGLGAIGPAASEVVPLLVPLVNDPQLGASAMRALGQVGQVGQINRGGRAAAAATAALQAVLRRALDGHDRSAAAQALGQLRPVGSTTVAALVRALRHDPEPDVQQAAVAALGRIGPRAAAAAPQLLAAIDAAGHGLTEVAQQALGRMGPRAVGPLMRALRHRNLRVVSAAVEALGAIGPSAARALPELVRLLRESASHDPSVARAIGQLGRRAAPAVGALLRVLDSDRHSPLAGAVIGALGRVGPAAARAIPKLVDAIRTRQHASAAAAALAGIGPSAVPALRRALADPHDAVLVAHAARALAECGLHSRAAVPQLATLLSDLRFVSSTDGPAQYVREAAAVALGRIGSAARPAVAELSGLLGDRRAIVRRAAAEALGRIGRPAAGGVTVQLERLIRLEQDQAVRAAARQALARLAPAASRWAGGR